MAKASITVTVQPWVPPFMLLFAQLGCSRKVLDAVARFACQQGMRVI